MTSPIVLFATSETKVHAGGSDGSPLSDRPIQRSATTGLPEFYGSTWKGSLKDAVRAHSSSTAVHLFGQDPPATAPGSVRVSAAQLVAFPVPSSDSCFAWITSRQMLATLSRTTVGLPIGLPPDLPPQPQGRAVGVSATSAGGARFNANAKVAFDDIVFDTGTDQTLTAWADALSKVVYPDNPVFDYWRAKLRDDLLLVDDGSASTLTELFSPVDDRVHLETGSKQVKNLFDTEYLPRDAILASRLVGPQADLDRALDVLNDQPILVGGDVTVGAGTVWLHSPQRSGTTAGQAPSEEETQHAAA